MRPSSLTIVAALALGATAAAAAPSPAGPAHAGGATPTPTQGCPTPDEAKCLSKGYLDSACGQQHLAICKPFAQAKMKAHYQASDKPTLKMLRPKRSEMPSDVDQGKYFHYTHPSPSSTGHTKYRSVYRKVGDELRGLQGMDMSQLPPVERVGTVSAETAKNWHRKPEWMEPSVWEVRSCEEYAYERSYGITRFIDAASACRGDMECVFDIAYMPGTPGISDRVLRTSDGNPLPTKLTLLTGPLPKNEMFVHGGAFVRSEGLLALPGVVVTTALEAALDQGKEFYKIGSCGGACTEPRKFKTQWQWHKFLHDKVTALSQAEHEEYERRLAQYRNLMEQWNAAVEWENSLLEGPPQNEQVIVLPIDMRAQDPFQRYGIEQEYIEHGRDTLQSLKAKFGNNVAAKSMPAIRNLAQQHMHGARTPMPVAGMLASPAPAHAAPQTNATTSTHGGAMHVGEAANGAISKCLKDADEWGLESAYKGPISCRIGEFLRAEWKRKEQGHKSCLDVNNFGCDWTPAMFQASVLDKVPALDQQVGDLAYCKAWDTPNTFKSPYVPPQKEVTARLDANKAAKEDADKLIGGYIKGSTSKGRKLGKDWEGGDYLGNKHLFAVGYDYDTGWSAEPQARAGGDSGFVCELSGDTRANTGFDAWILDNKISVVDGQVAARANYQGDGDLKFAAHLEMFDQTVFSTGRDAKKKVKWKSAQTFGDDPDMGFMIEVPSFKPRFDIYVGVPVSGQMWGELQFGSSLAMSGQASAACDTSNPKLGVVAEYGPFFGAYGLGEVGIGIAGIASAGVRASLNLILISLPVSGDMRTLVKDNPKTNGNDPTAYLRFSSKLALTLGTMSGRVSLYVEFFTFDEEFELFRWKGFGPTTATLMPLLSGDMAMIGFDK